MKLNENVVVVLLFGMILLINSRAFCQYGNIRNGYVILESGDTLRGKLKVL